MNEQIDSVEPVAAEERRIGVYICHCGGNISDYVDVAAVRDALKDEPGVVVAETSRRSGVAVTPGEFPQIRE